VADRSRLIVVNGPPGAGKSTLAEPLAARLDLPLLAKDAIKEALGDALDLGGPDWSGALSRASWSAMWELAANGSAVIEGNFSAPAIEPIRAIDPRAIEVFCRCDLATCRDRYVARLTAGRRHRVHVPSEPPLSFFAPFDEPLHIGPVVEVPTDEPVDLEAVVEQVQRHLNR
jgi:adenylylsulfate kinase-like enzyme